MTSKYTKDFQIPVGFPEVLRDFTREVLREQPTDVHEFAYQYFKSAIRARDEGPSSPAENHMIDAPINQAGGAIPSSCTEGKE